MLRQGWTTGACAAAASRAAFAAMLTGRFPDPVAIRLPRGGTATFPLALAELSGTAARAGVVKDAGAGLSLAVGEPAINPAPRALIRDMLIDAATEMGAPPPDVTVTFSIPGGVSLAEKTMNARLGIVGGLSILGTTGIVVPYSCASWIHSIHRGIDVARAAGLGHIAAATGATSERAVQRLYNLPDHALVDMGDFVGGTLKYLRRHPVKRLTIAGGFAKLAKLAAGHLDLHSARSRVDIARLAGLLGELGAEPGIMEAAHAANGAAEILGVAGEMRETLARAIAGRAREVALATISGKTAVEVAIVDRQGTFLACVGM
jgi:cobalt-precorrin-5B (C1)-methyltransferase